MTVEIFDKHMTMGEQKNLKLAQDEALKSKYKYAFNYLLKLTLIFLIFVNE